jgi:hypothetical protein
LAERVLIASTNPWSFCMAVERDIAAIETEAGATVDAIDLYRLCTRSSPHPRRRDKLVETLNRNIDRFVMPAINGRNITGDIAIHRSAFPAIPTSYDALREYTLDEAKIGLAVLSSVSSLTTIQFPESLTEFGPALGAAWRSAHLSLRLGQAITALGYDRVWIFNGRHCSTRPFCDVVERNSKVIRYEQGSAGNRYISNAGSVHHPEPLTRLIESHEFDPEAGEAFFQARLEKHSSSEATLMTAKQRDGALPTGMSKSCSIAFFTSASDEMFAVTDDPQYGSFTTQHDIAIALLEACEASGLQLVVRLHPHLRFKHSAWRREWDFLELRRRGALIVDPEDPADSYEMLRNSRAVVTTGSTVGFEASYLGIPNAVVGTWLAGCLGASAVANTPDELAVFLAAPRLLPEARERALLFGSFYRIGGKLLPELDVGTHPNLARIGGRVVDPIRSTVQKLRFLFTAAVPGALDIRSGMQEGRVLLPPGTDYSSEFRRRKAGGRAA